MPKNEHSLMDSATLPLTRHRIAVIDDTRYPADWALDGMETDTVPPLDLRSMADAVPTETTFTEDDPRACPRDLEEFRLALAADLDRLRQNKKKYDY
jgi:hypothetical protein